MIVGSVEVKLVIRESFSLKDKRRVIKSLRDQIHNKFNVSVAEVGAQDNRQLSIFGIAAVGNSSTFIEQSLNKVVDFIRRFPGAELIDYELEV